MLDVGNLCKDALNFILAQHFGQALVLFGTGDTAIVLPFAAFHLLVIELDSIDAHILLRHRNLLLVHKIEYVLVDVRHFQAVDVPSLVIFHEVAEIGTVCFDGRGAVTLLFQQLEVAFRQCVFPFRFGMPHVNPAVINIGVG